MNPAGDSIRVIVINDDTELLSLTAAYLSHEDDRIEVITAETAEAALELLETETVDCVVSDYHLPGLNGLELLETLEESRPELPFILFTATGNETIASRAIAAGVTEYVPLTFDDGNAQSVLTERVLGAVARARSSMRTRVESQHDSGRRNELFGLLVESVSDHGIFLLDTQGNVASWNVGAERINGYTAEEILGRHLETFYLPEARANSVPEQNLEQARVDGLFEEEGVRLRKNGTAFEAAVSMTALTDADGQLLGFAKVVRDLTRERYVAEIERQNDRLDSFAGVLTHDLRNPLTVASGRLELLDDELDSEHIAPIRRSLQRMNELIEDVLAFAREGRTVRDIASVGLADVAASAWGNVAHDDAVLELDGELGTVLAERSRLRTVFENLFRNAVEHGGGSVTVTVGELSDGFYVEDDGLGIADDRRSMLFERAPEEGRFGLAIVGQVCGAHGWSIRATESDTGGARFEITAVTPVEVQG